MLRSRARWAVAAVFALTSVLTAFSRGGNPPIAVEAAVKNLRTSLLAPFDDGTNAFWASGSGWIMGMDMTVSLHYDDSGRFAFTSRGPLAPASGFDGTTTWKHAPSGETRILQSNDGVFVRLPNWMITGYWLSPDAPVTLTASDKKSDKNEMTIKVIVHGSALVGTVYVDTVRWVIKRFVVNDYGQDLGISFDHWQQCGPRWVPREIVVTAGGRVDSRVVLDHVRPDDDATLATYAPVDDKLVVTYTSALEGKVESKRGRWGHQFVRIRVNGKDIGWIAFDTGASTTHLNTDTASELGLEIVGDIVSSGMGGSIDQGIAILESIEIGPARFENIPVNVSGVNVSLGISDNQGLLGMDVLRHCVIEYDQANSVIGLYNPSTYTLDSGEWKPLLAHNGKPFVEMRFEGHDGLFTIDTGNPGGLIMSPHTVGRLSLLKGRTTRDGSLGGIGGSVNAKKGTLAWVDWGHERFVDVPASFVSENKGVGADRSRDGIIGTDLLRRYRVVFDMTHGRIAYLPH